MTQIRFSKRSNVRSLALAAKTKLSQAAPLTITSLPSAIGTITWVGEGITLDPDGAVTQFNFTVAWTPIPAYVGAVCLAINWRFQSSTQYAAVSTDDSVIDITSNGASALNNKIGGFTVGHNTAGAFTGDSFELYLLEIPQNGPGTYAGILRFATPDVSGTVSSLVLTPGAFQCIVTPVSE